MIKRSEYMNGSVSHDAYYGQFCTKKVIEHVKAVIGEDRIRKSTDPNMNDIPLKEWDGLNYGIRYLVGNEIQEANRPSPGAVSGISLSDTVCVGKAAARMIREALSSPNP